MDPSPGFNPSQPHVKVYVWEHASSQKIAFLTYQVSKYSPGHVSLETHTGGEANHVEYISFWPGGTACKCPSKTSHLHTYAQDMDAEKNQKPKEYRQ